MMSSPLPGEHFEPEWLRLAARAFARGDPTPELSFELCASGEGPDTVVRGRGGATGTHVGLARGESVDLRIKGPAIVLLGYISGRISPESLSSHPDVIIEGETARMAELPDLFDVPSEGRTLHRASETPTQQGAPE
ncbi:MAG: hypothetical protein JRH01_19975 [Deltaproteobacteria bacterium]|nr:hypothetical protein [Deltaproteobacteria bacterium]